MSYDLHLFSPQPDVDLLESAVASLESETEDAGDAAPDAGAEQRRQRLVAALQAALPGLEPFAFDYAAIAQHEGIAEHEARRRFRHVELNGPEDGTGLQITLFDQHASVTVPHWHGEERAVAVFRDIWICLGVLQREAGMRAYDPQLEQVVDLDSDFDAVLKEYARGVEVTQGAAQHATRKKPWWRFW